MSNQCHSCFWFSPSYSYLLMAYPEGQWSTDYLYVMEQHLAWKALSWRRWSKLSDGCDYVWYSFVLIPASPLPKSFSSVRGSVLNTFVLQRDTCIRIANSRKLLLFGIMEYWSLRLLFTRLFPECSLCPRAMLGGSGAWSLRISCYGGSDDILSEIHQQINSLRTGTLFFITSPVFGI